MIDPHLPLTWADAISFAFPSLSSVKTTIPQKGPKSSLAVLGLFLLTLYTLTSVFISPYCSLYIYQGADKENFFNNQEFLKLMVISLILMSLICDSVVTL